MKNKILIFTLISIIVVSIFVVPCFAYSVSDEQEYTFKEELDPSVFGESSSVYLDADFYIKGHPEELFITMAMFYRGYYVLAYDTGDGEITVWRSDTGWVDESYRSIVFANSYEFSSPWNIFFEKNEYIETFSVYGTIYSLIADHLFVGHMEDNFVQLTVTFLAVLLTMAIFIFPFGISYAVFKMIINAIDRSL